MDGLNVPYTFANRFPTASMCFLVFAEVYDKYTGPFNKWYVRC